MIEKLCVVNTWEGDNSNLKIKVYSISDQSSCWLVKEWKYSSEDKKTTLLKDIEILKDGICF